MHPDAKSVCFTIYVSNNFSLFCLRYFNKFYVFEILSVYSFNEYAFSLN